MLLNLKTKFKNIKDEEIQGNESTIGEVVGSHLWIAGDKLGDAGRFCDIGKGLYNNGEYEVSESEAKKITEFFDKNQELKLHAFMKSQITSLIDMQIRENKSN